LLQQYVALCTGYMRQLIDRIEIDDEKIRILGGKAALAGGVMGSGGAITAGVASFVPEWWAQ
jgi:Ni,Fe-hydrogenase III small subunit